MNDNQELTQLYRAAKQCDTNGVNGVLTLPPLPDWWYAWPTHEASDNRGEK
jgi:hypothetical protein